jgi:ferric-dicitrate binding protein FerR (iron transport regulator)
MATDHDWLERLFAEARAQCPRPSDALTARVLADAEAERPRPAAPVAPATPPPATPRRGLLREWASALGGGLALGGLAAAAATGFWIGVAPPSALPALAPGIWGEATAVGLGLDDPLSLLEG